MTYIAKHGSGGNDDEGAVAYALKKAGCEVVLLDEHQGCRAMDYKSDLVLFHKWYDPPTLRKVRGVKAFWYFDLVDFPDATMRSRCAARMSWMDDIMPLVDIGFCTDGDWVERNPKLRWLTQGADERRSRAANAKARHDVLLTGISAGGNGRQSFVQEMQLRYGKGFQHVERGTHGHDLATLIARSKIVVAPDAPVTDKYWSNRVYLSLGFGAFMLHPYCSKLTEHYTGGRELIYYHNRDELHDLVKYYCGADADRQRIADLGHRRTKLEHTYTARVAELLRTVRAL